MENVRLVSSKTRYEKLSVMTCLVLAWFQLQALAAFWSIRWTNVLVAAVLYWVGTGLGIALSVDGLPKGVTCPPQTLGAGLRHTILVLSASADVIHSCQFFGLTVGSAAVCSQVSIGCQSGAHWIQPPATDRAARMATGTACDRPTTSRFSAWKCSRTNGLGSSRRTRATRLP